MSDKLNSNDMVSRELFEKMEQLHTGNMWSYVQSFARACDYIGVTFGDEAVRQFHIESGKKRAIPTLELALEKGVDKFMTMICQHMNNVGGEFTLNESGQEIIVRGTCGTGGRYVREVGSAVNDEGVPYYCVHCPIWWEEMPQELGLNMSFEIGEQGIGCAWIVKK